MKAGTLARSLLRALAALCVLAAFVVLDWYPTVKDLGRLRRERSDWDRKIKDYGAMAGNLQFSDAEENTLLAQMDCPGPPGADCGWIPTTPGSDWLAPNFWKRAKGRADAVMLFRQDEALDFGPPGLRGWLTLQEPSIRQVFRAADPLYGVFPLNLATECRLTSQPLGIALAGPAAETAGLHQPPILGCHPLGDRPPAGGAGRSFGPCLAGLPRRLPGSRAIRKVGRMGTRQRRRGTAP